MGIAIIRIHSKSRVTQNHPYKKPKNWILKYFYFAKSAEKAIGDRLFSTFRKILFYKIV
jgi:hypothetical protein